MLDTAKITAWFVANAIKIGIAVALFVGGVFTGAEWKETRYENATAKSIVKQSNKAAETTAKRTKEAFKESERIREMQEELATTREKLDEAIRRANRPPACDLSDDEFVRFNELAKQASGD